MAKSVECESCGNIYFVTEGKCPYCGSINIVKEDPQKPKPSVIPPNTTQHIQNEFNNFSNRVRNRSSEINPILLVILLIFCWPIGLVYLIIKLTKR